MSAYDEKKAKMLELAAQRARLLYDLGVDQDGNATIRTPGKYDLQGDVKTQVQNDILRDEFRVNDPKDVAAATQSPLNLEDQVASSTSYDVVGGSEPVALRRKALESGLSRAPGNDQRTDPHIQQSLESPQETDYERAKRLQREALYEARRRAALSRKK